MKPTASAATPETVIATPDSPRPSRLNAFRHGLTSQTFLFTPEEAEAWASHCSGMRNYFEPVGPLEESLTDQIATGIWRLQRAAAMEQGVFSKDADSQPDPAGPAQTWLSQAKNIQLLSLYEGRIRRALDRDKAELQAVQQARKQQAAKDMDTAVALYKYAEANGKPYQPDLFFTPIPQVKNSVFSEDHVLSELTRREFFSSPAAALKPPLPR